jgi:glycerophosphoryl diester phosphodiesterase
MKVFLLVLLFCSSYGLAYSKSPSLFYTLAQNWNTTENIQSFLSSKKKNHHLHLPVVASKDGVLFVSSEINVLDHCKLNSVSKSSSYTLNLAELTASEISNVTCQQQGATYGIRTLDQTLKELAASKTKFYIESLSVPYLSNFTHLQLAKKIDQLLRKYKMRSRVSFISKDIGFLRTVKGLVNKDYSIIFKSDSNNPGYLNLALYYNLKAIAPHYQWLSDSELKKIRGHKKKVKVILWGGQNSYMIDKILSRPIHGAILDYSLFKKGNQ